MKHDQVTMLDGSFSGLRVPEIVGVDPPKGTLAISNGFIRTKLAEGWQNSADVRDRLFNFSDVTFKAPIVGFSGPTLNQVRALLPIADYPWAHNPTFLNAVNGTHVFLVPMDGQYRITAQGATRCGMSGAGARSAICEVEGVFDLKAGDKLYIVVGQLGNVVNGVYYRIQGGAGGTFVSLNAKTLDSILLVSGGASTAQLETQNLSTTAPLPVDSALNGTSGQYIDSSSGSGAWRSPLANARTYQGDSAYADGSYVYRGIAGAGGGIRTRTISGERSPGSSFEAGSTGGIAQGVSQYRANGGFGGGGGNGYPNADYMQGRFVPGSGGYSGGYASGNPQPVAHVGGAGGNYLDFARALSNASRVVVKSSPEGGSCRIQLVG